VGTLPVEQMVARRVPLHPRGRVTGVATDPQPWHGILVAAALPLREDLSVDFDAYAEHIRFVAEGGCQGVVPNGSLGEYQTLTAQERARVVHTAVAAAGHDVSVVPGVAA
jgi:dihydrodipicolinate synthase/N-acetylneuraminate lyase